VCTKFSHKIGLDGSNKSGAAQGAPSETRERKPPPWDFTAKSETQGGGAQAEKEAKQRQETRRQLEVGRVRVIAEWLDEVVGLEDNVTHIAKGLVDLGATTVADVSYVTEEEMRGMGFTEDGDPVLLPVPAAKLRAAVAVIVGESPTTGQGAGVSEVVVREVVAANTEMPKLPEPTKGKMDAAEVSLFAARLVGALRDTAKCGGLATMVEDLRRDPSEG